MNFLNLLADLFSLLFPNLCCACARHLHKGESGICSTCIFQIPYTDHHLHADNKVARKFWGRIPLHTAIALLYFKKGGSVQSIIHHLKYKGRQEAGTVLGKLMADQLKKTPDYGKIDLVIAVPLHESKFRSRGYNQSHCIAAALASELGIPLNKDALIRVLATESQTRKGRYKRHENMRAAFQIIAAEALHGKHVLLVDDVITTGATLEACAEILYKNGVREVSIAVGACAD